MNRSKLRIGVIGTSWWADAMYLPPLSLAKNCVIAAVCGRDSQRLNAFADRWSIPSTFTDYRELISAANLDAVVIATGNETHFPISMAAMDAGLHVLCEKPLGLNYAEAHAMAAKAAEKGTITLVPFTYRFMPTTRYVKHLIDSGYLGSPYHLHLRYYATYGRNETYMWRFDRDKAGSGAWGDIGSHFIYLAQWFYGDIRSVCTDLATRMSRPDLDPDGNRYQQTDDTAMAMLRFESGAQGVVHASTICHEQNQYGQVHEMDFHGSDGTLRHRIDWNTIQQITGSKVGGGPTDQPIDVPDEFWGSVRRDNVIDTYKDTFRLEGHMVRRLCRCGRIWQSGRARLRRGAPKYSEFWMPG